MNSEIRKLRPYLIEMFSMIEQYCINIVYIFIYFMIAI